MTGVISMILPGVSNMANIHPMIVHFPIALLNAFVLMEILHFAMQKDEFRTAATWMLYLGTLGAAGAVAAGLWAAATVPHPEEVHDIMENHEHLGITVLVIAAFLSVWRFRVNAEFSEKGRIYHLVLGIIMIIIMAFGADFGGLMVYKYGVGVKAVKVSGGHSHLGMGEGAYKAYISEELTHEHVRVERAS